MTNQGDQQLAKLVREGNEAVFVTLIRRYERVLAGLFRSRLGSGEQVQDVLQETLVRAWRGLRRETPRDVRPWLLQVARNRCPDGTVKRRLSHGRDRIRRALGLTPKTRKTDMKTQKQAFPWNRPEIRIHPSREKPFRIDFKEMAWWFVQPEAGDRVGRGEYDGGKDDDAPWRLFETVWLTVRRPAVIHGRLCAEVEVEEVLAGNTSSGEKSRITKVWGRLADDEVEWIAVESKKADGVRELTTFLDEGFHDDWWSSPRVVEDCGCLSERADGTWVRQPNAPAITGAGVFDVHVGGRQFTCLRVFEVKKNATERDVLIEAYITRAGRTVLFRRYSGSRWSKRDAPPHNWGEAMTWEEDLPRNDRIVIDGVTYVHHYDILSAAACGIAD